MQRREKGPVIHGRGKRSGADANVGPGYQPPQIGTTLVPTRSEPKPLGHAFRHGAASRVRAQAGFGQDARAVRRRERLRPAAVRGAAARRAAAPLRLPPRARRCARELGGSQGSPARDRRAAPGRPRRGSPARLRDLRGRDPGRTVRSRHGRDLGRGVLRPRRGEAGRRSHRPSRRPAAPGRLDARSGQARRRSEGLALDPQGRREDRGAQVRRRCSRRSRKTSRPRRPGSSR